MQCSRNHRNESSKVSSSSIVVYHLSAHASQYTTYPALRVEALRGPNVQSRFHDYSTEKTIRTFSAQARPELFRAGGKIIIETIESDGKMLEAVYPICVDISREDGMLVAKFDQLGLDAYAETKEELSREVHEQLGVLWQAYALESDEKLTLGARKLKTGLLAKFREKTNASKKECC